MECGNCERGEEGVEAEPEQERCRRGGEVARGARLLTELCRGEL